MDTKLAVHDGIVTRADSCGAYCVTETCCSVPREIDQVLSAFRLRARDHFRFSDAVERCLASQFACQLDRPHNGVEIAIGAEVIAFDDGRIAPIRTGEPHTSAAGRLNERRRDREAFLRGS